MKKTKRKGFNFFRSYYDVYNELSDKDKLSFIEALLDKQFLGINPKGLEGMAKFAWISQVNSIDSQVKGFQDKTGIILHPTEGGVERVENTPTEQVEGKGEEEVQVQDSVKNPITKFTDWFNERRKSYLDKESNFKRLSYTDTKNLNELKELYGKEDFEKVMINMCNDKYCNEANRIVPSHFLGYFDNYISMDVKPVITKKQKTNRGWSC